MEDSPIIHMTASTFRKGFWVILSTPNGRPWQPQRNTNGASSAGIKTSSVSDFIVPIMDLKQKILEAIVHDDFWIFFCRYIFVYSFFQKQTTLASFRCLYCPVRHLTSRYIDCHADESGFHRSSSGSVGSR